MNLKQTITHNLLNIPGWRTNRHIVVIESDDWGSIRIPSKEVYDKLLKAGIRVDKCHYCMNDSIASDQDLSMLFETLNSVRDSQGSPAVLTANVIVANPDFQKIKDSGFEHYSYRVISDVLPQIPGCERIFELWKEGNEKQFFRLQSHGREHLNVSRWMQYLRSGYPETRFAFEQGVYGLSTTVTSEKRKSFLPALDFETSDEELQVNQIASEGLRIFENLFGFKSKSFIAPNYTWGRSMEDSIAVQGVEFVQGMMLSRYVNISSRKSKLRLRKIGKNNTTGLIDLGRNAMFEPSENLHKDWVDSCLQDIEIAFRWKHPAILSSHRVNYVGVLNPSNRDNGLRQLSVLLRQIIKLWPDVEFMSSDQLGELIKIES